MSLLFAFSLHIFSKAPTSIGCSASEEAATIDFLADSNMEESLLLPKYREDEQQRNKSSSDSSASTLMTWGSFFEEVKRLGCIAGPMVAVILSQYLLQVISMMMVGHLGELALSSTAIAISLSGVTGFSLFVSFPSS